ncbi:hypothetical protein BCR43DRAFT_509074 [Syncephalastrum racemosum]|uniref:Uncharacterized protein n=1 Tax=Syncephalastrum racemosum TaxID=13706 RepID=A0A1X2GZG0_SYNRA|nr:hypothetical protein BCR43DRAFT_509074 [Syncephalastrum racemosum]
MGLSPMQRAARKKQRGAGGRIISKDREPVQELPEPETAYSSEENISSAEESEDIDDMLVDDPVEYNDCGLLGISEDDFKRAERNRLIWFKNADEKLTARGRYFGDGRSTLFRKQSQMKAAAKVSSKLEAFGFSSISGTPDNQAQVRGAEDQVSDSQNQRNAE